MGSYPGVDAMARNVADKIIRHLRQAALGRDQGGWTDAALLEEYVTRQDETAFEALLRRHGPMVFGVCRRVLHNQADAEDAFQATFLVLVRKAASLRSGAKVGNWLYGVAHNTALKAKAMNRKRRLREREAGTQTKSNGVEQDWAEVQGMLDAQLSLLPDCYRVAIVLCDLEGRTIKEAARHLGWPQGTTATRLTRGRALLARRLTKQGLALPTGMLAAATANGTATARVTPLLLRSTLAAARCWARRSVATGLISARVSVLAQGVLQSMFMQKLMRTVGLVLLAGLALGTATLTRQSLAADPPVAAPTRSAQPNSDQGNLKETLLALEKRVWDALKTEDRTVFQNLVASDFVGLDISGRHYDKADTLQFVANVRVPQYEMKNVRVIVLNETSALVTYDIHYKLNHVGEAASSEILDRHALRAWSQRKGKWWYVYYEDRLLQKTRRPDQLRNNAADPSLEAIQKIAGPKRVPRQPNSP
jgi:RNA polymerase sigma factor (sigma-70 family)